MRNDPRAKNGGSILLGTLVIASLLGAIASLLILAAAQGWGVHMQTRGRLQGQRVAEAAYFLLHSCLLKQTGSAPNFASAFAQCRSKVHSLEMDGRSYRIRLDRNDVPPYRVGIRAEED